MVYEVKQMMQQVGEKPCKLRTIEVYADSEAEAIEIAYEDCINAFYHSRLGSNRKGMTKFWAELV